MANTFSLGKNPNEFYENLTTFLASSGTALYPQQIADLNALLSKTPDQIASGDFLTPDGLGRLALYTLMAMSVNPDKNHTAIVLASPKIMTNSNIGKLVTMPQIKSADYHAYGVVLNGNIIVASYPAMPQVLSLFDNMDNVSAIIAGDAQNIAGKARMTKLRDIAERVPVFGLDAAAKFSRGPQDLWLPARLVAQKYIVGNYIRVRNAIVAVHNAQQSKKKYLGVQISKVVKGHTTSMYLYDSPQNIDAFIRAASGVGYKFERRVEPLEKFLTPIKDDQWLTPVEIVHNHVQGNIQHVTVALREIYAAQKKKGQYKNIRIERRMCGCKSTLLLYNSSQNINAFIGALHRRGMVATKRTKIAHIPRKTDNWLPIVATIKKYIANSQDKVRRAIKEVIGASAQFPDVKWKNMLNYRGSQGIYIYDSEENIAALIAAARSLGHDISRRDDSIPAKTPDWERGEDLSKYIFGNKDKFNCAIREIYAAQHDAANPRFADVEIKYMRSYANITLCLHVTDENMRAFINAATELGYQMRMRTTPKAVSFARAQDAVQAAAAVALARMSSDTIDVQKQH